MRALRYRYILQNRFIRIRVYVKSVARELYGGGEVRGFPITFGYIYPTQNTSFLVRRSSGMSLSHLNKSYCDIIRSIFGSCANQQCIARENKTLRNLSFIRGEQRIIQTTNPSSSIFCTSKYYGFGYFYIKANG